MLKSNTATTKNYRQEEDEKEEEEEEEEAAEEDYNYPSSSYTTTTTTTGGKIKGRNRSKHSETEHRRRSKINERFQMLRNLIPPNDHKRDKASFLLEVIQYIQFLQEKVRMYEEEEEEEEEEGSCRASTRHPAKLVPWKNNPAPTENMIDHSQVVKNVSIHENIEMFTHVPNSADSDLGTAALYKTQDYPTASTTSAIPFDVPMESNMFSAVGWSVMPMQESVSDVQNMVYQIQSQLWQVRPCATECAAPDNALNGEEELKSDTGSASMSSAYSQGILDVLTQALESSGVDLSQTSISVQIDVGKQGKRGESIVASSTKDQRNQYLSNQVMEVAGFGSYKDESGQAYKRMRIENS